MNKRTFLKRLALLSTAAVVPIPAPGPKCIEFRIVVGSGLEIGDTFTMPGDQTVYRVVSQYWGRSRFPFSQVVKTGVQDERRV